MKKLSIIVPCFNEELLLGSILDKILKTNLAHNIEKEIIVIDDASKDGTFRIAEMYAQKNTNIIIHKHQDNLGKGACIQTGLGYVTGEIVLVQDSDLEYDPRDYNRLLEPLLEGYADVVYGSRFTGNGPHRVLFYFHTIGNKLLTFLSNLFTQINLTDMETGYKIFRTEILKQITLKEKRFGFEPEVTAKVSRIKNIRIYEIGIAYYGRTYKEGKKINWRDGFRTIYCILKYNLFDRR